jgi:hypothetical protein
MIVDLIDKNGAMRRKLHRRMQSSSTEKPNEKPRNPLVANIARRYKL